MAEEVEMEEKEESVEKEVAEEVEMEEKEESVEKEAAEEKVDQQLAP